MKQNSLGVLGHLWCTFARWLKLFCFASLIPLCADPQKVLLDKIAMTINDLVILESDVQYQMKLQAFEAKDLKIKAQSPKALRKKALETLINLSIFFQNEKDRIKLELEQDQMTQSRSEYEKYQLLRKFHASTLLEIGQINYELQQAEMNEGQRQSWQQQIHLWQQEAVKLNVDPELHVRYSIIQLQLNSFSQALMQNSAPTIILGHQIDSEVETLIKEILMQSHFILETLSLPIQKSNVARQADKNFQLFSEISKLAKGEGEHQSLFEIMQYMDQKKAFETWPQFKKSRKTWKELPSDLQVQIKSLKTGLVYGPMVSQGQLHLYKIRDIQLKNLVQEVQKYSIRVLFQKTTPLSGDPLVRRNFNHWLNQIKQGEADFSSIIMEHGEHFLGSDERGAVEWKTLDSMSDDVKVQNVIEKLDFQTPFSDPFKGDAGWYLIELIDKKIEKQDFRELETLKDKARQRIIWRSGELALKDYFEIQKNEAKIEYFND